MSFEQFNEAIGLSPRVRGNRVPGLCRPEQEWSIPACAGEPPDAQALSHLQGVYPRVCGGTAVRRGSRIFNVGLSPRVRGNPTHQAALKRSRGSIPACAGEPALPTVERRSSTVYPRVCGGTRILQTAHLRSAGLSPRVRGNRRRAWRRLTQRRSIPACAGEPGPSSISSRPAAVYPRVCGGTYPWAPLRQSGVGLSPRVRGNHGLALAARRPVRSIPACAGEPRKRSRGHRQPRVYPRVCGGTCLRA